METFLQNISPDLRRVVQRITGASSLKKHIQESIGKHVRTQLDTNFHMSAAAKKMGVRKNVQSKLFINSLGTVDKIIGDKERM